MSITTTPQSLTVLQQALGGLLWEQDGLGALESEAAFQAFIQRHALAELTPAMQERLKLYQELLYASVEDTAQSIYPICYQLIQAVDPKAWAPLIEEFRRLYPNTHHQLMRCVEHFDQFLAQQSRWVEAYPFLPELARYEWVEVEVANRPYRENYPPYSNWVEGLPAQDLTQLDTWCPVWNPVHTHLTLQWPVAQIAIKIHQFLGHDHTPDRLFTQAQLLQLVLELPKTPKSTQYWVYRNRLTNEVRFFELNPMTASLILLCQSVEGQECTYTKLLDRFRMAHHPHLNQWSNQQLSQEMVKLFDLAYEQGLFWGSKSVITEQ